MKNRSPIKVFIFSFITLGIYLWYWLVKTKTEMNGKGETIPTAWIWLIPYVGYIWWLWKYSTAVGNVSNEKMSKILAFVLLFLIGSIGAAIIQDTYNDLSPSVATATPPSTTPENVAVASPGVSPTPAVTTPPVAPQQTTPSQDSSSQQTPPTTPTTLVQ